MLQHMLAHAQPRPFVCEHCDAGFTTQQHLESHLVLHRPRTSWQSCNFSTMTRITRYAIWTIRNFFNSIPTLYTLLLWAFLFSSRLQVKKKKCWVPRVISRTPGDSNCRRPQPAFMYFFFFIHFPLCLSLQMLSTDLKCHQDHTETELITRQCV